MLKEDSQRAIEIQTYSEDNTRDIQRVRKTMPFRLPQYKLPFSLWQTEWSKTLISFQRWSVVLPIVSYSGAHSFCFIRSNVYCYSSDTRIPIFIFIGNEREVCCPFVYCNRTYGQMEVCLKNFTLRCG